MSHIKKYSIATLLIGGMTITSCHVPKYLTREPAVATPATYGTKQDSSNIAQINWRDYFNDPYLAALIDTALLRNQELQVTLQEIEIARSEVKARKGEILPNVNIGAGAGIDKASSYTVEGAGDEQTQIIPGKESPKVMPDMSLGLYASWEVDIWKKLRNAKAAAAKRYLSTIEGKNFVVTNLVAEIAENYYRLLALDNQIDIIRQTITIQENALEIVKVQKEAARATELGVKKFEAEVLNSKGRLYDIQQEITETENRINFLLARFPQPIPRDKGLFAESLPRQVEEGIPSQLLINRPDIRQAELELAASKLDVQVARAAFYPRLDISAALGLQSFSPQYFARLPESMIFSLVGDLVQPLINKNAIKAQYAAANARQQQAIVQYERSILSSYVEVANQLSNIKNLEQRYDLKSKEVEALNRSVDVAGDLFKYARADYFEVLMTQRDALESKLEMMETKEKQYSAMTNIYRALGGGWQ